MNRVLVNAMAVTAGAVFAVQPAEAAKWKYEPTTAVGCGCPGGVLTIWATNNGVQLEPALYDGWTNYTQVRNGSLPRELEGLSVNDFDAKWDCAGDDPGCTCANVWTKGLAPVKSGGRQGWELQNLSDWIEAHVTTEVTAPVLVFPGCASPVPDIYIAVDLGLWDNRPIQSEYFVVDGHHADLPGYLIGTTPIVFDPNAPPEVYPLSTTPFNGLLVLNGDAAFGPDNPVPTASTWGLVFTTLLIVAAGAVVILRRQRATAAA